MVTLETLKSNSYISFSLLCSKIVLFSFLFFLFAKIHLCTVVSGINVSLGYMLDSFQFSVTSDFTNFKVHPR